MSLPCILGARGSGHHCWGAREILVPARKNPHSTGLRDLNTMKGVSVKGTLPGHLDPTRGQPWDSGLLRSRDGIRAHVLEVRGNKVGITFSFSLVSFQCSVEV